jgi:hypothetical protein
MKLTRSYFTLLAAVAVVALAASSAAAQNLLDNPGFEDPVTNNGAPFDDNWEAFTGGGTTTSNNSNLQPRSGAQHLLLQILASNNNFAGAFQDVTVAAGQSLTFSGWNKAVALPLGLGAEHRIEWRSASAEVGRTGNIVPALTTDYTQFSMTAVAPAGAIIGRVVYAVQTFGPEPGDTGTVYLDDMSATVIPEPASAALVATCALGLFSARRRRLA